MVIKAVGRTCRRETAAVLAGVLRCTAATGTMAGIGLATLVATAVQSSDTLTPKDGARLGQKISAIVRHSGTGASEARLTPLLESEINAFLMFQGASQLPTGITHPVLRIGEEGLVSGEAVVDLDVVRQQREGGWLDPLQYLSGRISVAASATVRSGEGMARVNIRSVTVSGVPVPVQVLRELVRHYTRSVDEPDGTRLDEPIPLPYRISELRLSLGRAVIVQ